MMFLATLAAPALAIFSKILPADLFGQTTFAVEPKAAECCALLNELLPERVYYPGSDLYTSRQAEYYSQEQQITTVPACRVGPKNAQEVSKIVAAASKNECSFAVKSGGHMAWLGASNIGGSGFAIDLEDMHSVSVSEDLKTVSVASGSEWYEVYKELVPHNITVVGGRSAGVGAGGFLTHGGISFLSISEGFGSDNVINYEVVLADGSIVNANVKENADLFWAIKVGSTNYGIVTRFDMVSYPLGGMWAGFQLFTIDQAAGLIDHLMEFTHKMNDNPMGMTALSIAWYPPMQNYIIWAPVMYFKPEEYPPLMSGLKPFKEAAIHDAMGMTTIVDMSETVLKSAPGGGRAHWFSLTVKPDSKLLWDMHLRGDEMFKPLLDRAGAKWALTAQPMNKGLFKAMDRNGGNPLGMNGKDGDLILILGSVFWDEGKDDEIMTQKTHDLIILLENIARERDLLHPFIYMNYAYGSQDVYRGIDAANYEKMKEIKAKYDPTDVFGRFWKGGFKL